MVINNIFVRMEAFEVKYIAYKILFKLIRILRISNLLSDMTYLKLNYYILIRKKLDLDNPKTFNEKLNWLKLYDRKPIYSTMVDKYEAKIYFANIIGEKYIIPTLGVYDKFEDIDFDKLPNQFVIKCTHDSGGLVICKDKCKLDVSMARKKINKLLKKNYYYQCREWPYKNVTPRIIIEKYMNDSNNDDLRDYKFFCFNGEPKYMKVDFDRQTNHRANYYDMNFKLQHFGEMVCPPDYNKKIEKPQNFDTMVEFARKLSKDIPFLRADFYNIDGKIYFGELTFYPAAGLGKFIPEEWDLKLGKLLNLPKGDK